MPDDTKFFTLNVIHKVNYFLPLKVDLDKIGDDNLLPDWQMRELSLCGYITMYDENLTLYRLMPSNDPFADERRVFMQELPNP